LRGSTGEAARRGEQWRRVLAGGANRMAREVKEMLEAALAEANADA
jgi:hypothetical protein